MNPWGDCYELQLKANWEFVRLLSVCFVEVDRSVLFCQDVHWHQSCFVCQWVIPLSYTTNTYHIRSPLAANSRSCMIALQWPNWTTLVGPDAVFSFAFGGMPTSNSSSSGLTQDSDLRIIQAYLFIPGLPSYSPFRMWLGSLLIPKYPSWILRGAVHHTRLPCHWFDEKTVIALCSCRHPIYHPCLCIQPIYLYTWWWSPKIDLLVVCGSQQHNWCCDRSGINLWSGT
jgi:hypothetical protein